MQSDNQNPLGGIERSARRPVGWVAPGPRPRGAEGRDDLSPRVGEDLCYLTGDWRIFQRVDGHRYSLDDLATAWFAAECATASGIDVRRAADIGCGIGSVLMMIAWRFPSARVVGVEAQPLSVDLARRSLAWNGADDRCEVRAGDLRDPTIIPEHATFDLVTGTPPYFPPDNGTISSLPQRGPCRFETRGGIEDYCLAASRLLSPHGVFVCCFDALHSSRVHSAATSAGLHVVRALDVIPRAGRAPLITLFAMSRAPAPATAPATATAISTAKTPSAPRSDLVIPLPWRSLCLGGRSSFPASASAFAIVVRDAAGQWTPAFLALRAAMGFPPPISPPAFDTGNHNL